MPHSLPSSLRLLASNAILPRQHTRTFWLSFDVDSEAFSFSSSLDIGTKYL